MGEDGKQVEETPVAAVSHPASSGDDDFLVVRFTMGVGELVASSMALRRSSSTAKRSQSRVLILIFTLAIAFLILAAMAFMAPRDDYAIPKWIWVLCIPFSCIPVVAVFLLSRNPIDRMLKEGINRNLLGPWKAQLAEHHILLTGECSEETIRWEGIERITTTKSHVVFFPSTVSCFCIPARDFESPAHFDAFVNTAKEFHMKRFRGLCGRCGYDLVGLASDRCPECGTATQAKGGRD